MVASSYFPEIVAPVKQLRYVLFISTTIHHLNNSSPASQSISKPLWLFEAHLKTASGSQPKRVTSTPLTRSKPRQLERCSFPRPLAGGAKWKAQNSFPPHKHPLKQREDSSELKAAALQVIYKKHQHAAACRDSNHSLFAVAWSPAEKVGKDVRDPDPLAHTRVSQSLLGLGPASQAAKRTVN